MTVVGFPCGAQAVAGGMARSGFTRLASPAPRGSRATSHQPPLPDAKEQPVAAGDRARDPPDRRLATPGSNKVPGSAKVEEDRGERQPAPRALVLHTLPRPSSSPPSPPSREEPDQPTEGTTKVGPEAASEDPEAEERD